MVKRVLAVLVVVVATLTGVSSAANAQTQVFTVHLAPTSTGDPDGSGVAVLRLDSDADVVCYTIVVRNIGAPTEPMPGIGSAHIHGPGGGIAIDLDTVFMAAGASTYIAHDCVSADSATIDAVLAHPEQYYVNVHNAEFPMGAVQGNLAS